MKKLLALILVLVMVMSLAACGTKTEQPDVTPSADVTDDTDDDSGATKLPEEIDVGFLKGPTGMGAAYFMQQNDENAYEIKYNVTLESDPSVITSALISGEIQIAAVPTNVALTLHNKTEGKVKIAAINTLGVLHILEKGDTIKSVSDLAGKTIYATGQASNPEYVLNYILRQNGLEPGVDVTIEYMPSDELSTRMAAGDFDVCMLPVPAATTVLMKNADVRSALDLTEEWAAVSGGSTLTQGCIVVRIDIMGAKGVNQFLRDYRESVEYMTDEANLDAAAELAVQYEIVGAVPVAKAALPDCNIVFVAGAATVKEYLDEYYNVLFEAEPTSIGGALPSDQFYYESDL